MANSILSSVLTSNAALKIYNDAQSNIPLWTTLGIMSVDIDSGSVNSDQPISTEQVSETSTYVDLLAVDIASGKIIRPSRLRIKALCSSVSTLESIINMFLDETAEYVISSKNIISASMLLTDVDLVQSPERTSATELTLTFEAADPLPLAVFSPAQAANFSVSNFISQTISSVTKTTTDLYNSVLTAIG